MQDEKISDQQNSEYDPALRTQRIMEYLVKQWQRPHEPSADTLKRITEFVIGLPEEYRTAGLTAIGDHFANNLILHFLDAMATFQQKAEKEGIDSEEREEYLSYVLTELFPKMVGLNRDVAIQSLDDLAALSNITLSLHTLSHIDTAEEAQSWMFELPEIYRSDLLQENLVVNVQDGERNPITSTTIYSSNCTDWRSYKENQGYVVLGTGIAQATKLTRILPSPKLVQFSIETKTPAA